MKTLLDEAFKRLEGGAQAQGVFRLSQSMGGGKTHNLIALGLLAKHPEWRETVMKGFHKPHNLLGAVRVAAFSGRQNDVPYGIWGEIARQIGKEAEFAPYYAPLAAPGQEAWVNLLRGEPLVILLDELPPYFNDARTKTIGMGTLADLTTTALANLMIAVSSNKLDNVVLVLTDLSGTSYQEGQQFINQALQNANAEATRLSAPIDPVRMNTDEFYHILRTRLFDDLPDEKSIQEVARAYGQALKQAKAMDITTASPEQFAADIESSYPFHPAIRDLYARFRENQGFHHIVRRTREYLEQTIDPATGEPYLQPVAVRLHGEGDMDALVLPAFLDQAYHHAEEFCREVGRRPGFSSGFLKTLLLRRVGSSIEAGRRTADKMLKTTDDENEETSEDDTERSSVLYPLEPAERASLQAFADALKANQDDDPKLYKVLRVLESGWLERGCIIFSQYYDSAFWLAGRLSERFEEETIAVYAGASRSGVLRNAEWFPLSREEIKRQVQMGAIRLMVGTDAASEGLNLQRLGTLINLDLPWNPTRLEQRKGRIQRIGQINAVVDIYNLRYQGSVEDRVHQLLSERFANIHSLFGQIPDTLEDVWMDVALSEEAEAKRLIDAVPTAHPFELRYDRIESVDWETCATPLAEAPQLDALRQGWTVVSG